MRRLLVLALLAAACGGLEAPDLSTGAIGGRVSPWAPGGRAYVLGRPELRGDVGANGAFTIPGVPVGAAVVVVWDGVAHAGQLPAVVRGAEVTWVGPEAPLDSTPVPPTSGVGGEGEPAPSGALPLAGAVQARALVAGSPAPAARFTVEGTELVDVVADATGLAVLAPLPPGTFTLVARADGAPDARTTVQVVAGQTTTAELALTP